MEDESDAECGGNDQKGICRLGVDQVLAILDYLPAPSVIAFGMTCRRFRELANSDALWASICKREWGSKTVDTWPCLGINNRLGWKELHRKMLALGSVTWHKLYQGDIFPTARASHSMVTLSNRLVIYGGGHDGGRHLDDTWAAPLPVDVSETITWQQISAGIPGGRFGQSCIVVEDMIVIFGGINDNGIRQNDTWINKGINGNVSFWQPLVVATAPCARGAHAGCYAGNGKIVIFGGIGSDGIRLNDTWVLDLFEKPLPAWHKLNTVISPPARSGHSLNWIDEHRLILFGGRGTKFEVLNDVWMLDMGRESAEWVELRACELHPKHDFPAPRAGHSATTIFGGRVLIFGGEDAKRCRKGDVWVLDPSAGVPVGNFSASIAPPFMKTAKNSCRRERKFWKKLKQWGQPPNKRSFHGASPLHSGHAVLIFGGMVDGELMPTTSAGLAFDAQLFLLQLAP